MQNRFFASFPVTRHTTVIGSALLVLATHAPSVQDAPKLVSYRVNPAKSQFTVNTSTHGVLTHDRQSVVTRYSGEVKLLVDGGPTAAKVKSIQPTALQIVVQANSLKSVDELPVAAKNILDTRVRDDILEADKYPTIRFQSTKIVASHQKTQGKATVSGKLTLHGVTRAVSFPVIVNGDEKQLRAEAKSRSNKPILESLRSTTWALSSVIRSSWFLR